VTHRTDAAPALQDPQPQPTADPVVRLVGIADRLLTEVEPTAAFAEGNRLGLAWKLTGDGADRLRGELLARMPTVDRPMTRGEYALLLRRAAA
jgi:hypothetical protein